MISGAGGELGWAGRDLGAQTERDAAPALQAALPQLPHRDDEGLQLTAPGYRAVCPGDLPHLPQPFLPLTHHKNFLLFVFMSLTLCSSNSLSGSSVSFSQCPLWSVPLSLGFTSVGFPVSDSHSFCSNNLLNSVFKHMDSFAFLLLFSKGAVPICTDRLWGA